MDSPRLAPDEKKSKKAKKRWNLLRNILLAFGLKQDKQVNSTIFGRATAPRINFWRPMV